MTLENNDNNTEDHQPSQSAPQVSARHDSYAERDDVINKIAMAAIVEQRRARRWSIVWKTLTFVYITFFLFALFGAMNLSKQFGQHASAGTANGSGKHTAVIDLKGVIADETYANADLIIRGLRRAFKNSQTAGVILRINSPGGSPVQSAQIYDEMQRLRLQHPEIPLHAVIDDIGASGGYFVAAGAENIYANKASLVGSIGVIMGNFGFVGAMEKLGVERRVLTAGESKALADPFSPQNEKTNQHLKQMLGEVHQQFIAAVKTGRGGRLSNDPAIFSGLIWTAEKGLELGLVDGLADVRAVARDEIGAEKLIDFTPKPDLLENFANRIGVSISESFVSLFMSTNPQLQ